MSADYQLLLHSVRTGELLQLYDAQAVYELKYSRVLNGIGTFAFTLPADDALDSLFELDNLLDIQRTNPVTGRLETEDTYLVRVTDRLEENDFEFYVVGGYSLNHLLARRIIDPNDDPAAAGGYSTKAGPADTVMRAYVLEQCGASASTARRFPNFIVKSVAGVGENTGERLRHENLLDVLQKMSKKTGIDFLIQRSVNNALEMNIGRIGIDRSRTRNYPFAPFVQIDPQRGNMSAPRLLKDHKDEKNYVYAKAQGPGDTRIVFQQAGGTTGDSPLNRIEFTADVRNLERGNTLELVSSVRAELADNEPKIEFTFEIRGDEPGNTYRSDWDLGDTITAQWGEYSKDLRVSEIEITLQENEERLTIRLEDL